MDKKWQFLNNNGQTMMELVVGIGLLGVVVGAIAIVTVNNLQNSQYAKNQAQATKLAQENIEKIRTIKNSNFGVCTQQQMVAGGTSCSEWSDIWAYNFGKVSTTCTGCTSFKLESCTIYTGETRALCLKYIDPAASNRPVMSLEEPGEATFTSEIVIEDEGNNDQKRVTSRIYWSDASGVHSSDLVTILSKL